MDEWVPCKVRMPEHSKKVLIACNGRLKIASLENSKDWGPPRPSSWFVQEEVPHDFWWYGYGSNGLESVSHWRPLPELPA